MVGFSDIPLAVYITLAIAIPIILVVLIKLIQLRIRKHSDSAQKVVSPVSTEAELKAMLKELEDKKKLDELALKEQEKLEKEEKKKAKKAESKIMSMITPKKEPVVLEDTPQMQFKLEKSYPRFSWPRIRSWYLEKYHPGNIVLINMELTNGFHRLFKIKEKEEGFVFRGKKYLFDDDSKYYNLDTKLYTFDYHEQIVLPFKRKIPVTEIKKTIESTEGIDVEYAINPSTLQRFMTAKIAEGVMRGTQLDEFMKKLQTFLIVTMVASLVHLALFLWASGILQNLKVPGIIG